MFSITRATPTFHFQKSLILLALSENWDTTFSWSILTSLCTVISAKAVKVYSPVLLRSYVFSLSRAKSYSQLKFVVTGSTINLILRHFGGGPAHMCPSPSYSTGARYKVHISAESGFFGFSDKCETCLRVVGGNSFIFNVIYKCKTTNLIANFSDISTFLRNSKYSR